MKKESPEAKAARAILQALDYDDLVDVLKLAVRLLDASKRHGVTDDRREVFRRH